MGNRAGNSNSLALPSRQRSNSLATRIHQVNDLERLVSTIDALAAINTLSPSCV